MPRFWSIALLSLLAGCAAQTEPSRFYLLTPLPADSAALALTAPAQAIAVGVGPVELAGYLDRPQIVTRTSRQQLELADFDRWAEPLRDNVARVLAENLALLLPGEIAVFGWNRATPTDYQVTVEISRFDAGPGGQSHLDAQWSIFEDDGRILLSTHQARLGEPASSTDYAALVAGMNQTIDELSRAIAESLAAELRR